MKREAQITQYSKIFYCLFWNAKWYKLPSYHAKLTSLVNGSGIEINGWSAPGSHDSMPFQIMPCIS